MKLGLASAGNSYRLGASSDGNSLSEAGGAVLQFGDASATGLFEASGHIAYTSGGGSCMLLPAATNHDINGSFDAAGGVIFGAGNWTLNGYMDFGRLGGGAGTCNGVLTTVQGTNVTFVVSGANPIVTGTCAYTAFCIAAGYSNVALAATTSNTTTRLLVVGPQSGSTSGADFGQGGSNVSLSGTFYFPNGPIALAGGAGVGDKTGQCLTLIGTQVMLTGGTVVSSSCINGIVGPSPVIFVK